MAFVNVPKDLNKIKNKAFFNLTARQLICFGTAAAIGVPVYIFTRGTIGDTAAALLMIGLMLPLFFVAMYEKDGQPAEKILRNMIRTKFYFPGKRPYRSENLYETLEQEARVIANKTKAAAKAPAGKHQAGKVKSR
ncbi:MAG: PrgI family protein [Oscillospiraceae bacterium]|nr:PrgI family protein [Oscillospiraceae bacterium]